MRDAEGPEVVAQLRGIDSQLKRLLRKDSNCQCDCSECQAGNCIDCSNEDCKDPNCEANFVDEEVAALKQFAASLKGLAA